MQARGRKPAHLRHYSRLALRLGRRFVNLETRCLLEVVELLPNERAVLRNLTIESMLLPYSKQELSEDFKPVN